MIERPELQRVLFQFLKELVDTLALAKRAKTPPRSDRLLVLAAIALGTIEGRPFRAQKLAEYVGMPRTTLLRRLEELREEEWIGYDDKGRILARPERLNEPSLHIVYGRISTLIHRTHKSLLEIEQKENKIDQSGH
jgi:hypothetical protein